MSALPLPLFGLADIGIVIKPTIAMYRGEQAVFQCAQCGTVVVQSSLAPGPLGACPACGQGTWSRQQLPLAGLAVSS